MGYRISYENGGVRTRISPQKTVGRKRLMVWGAILAVAILAVCLHQSSSFRRLLLPGNKAVTEAAVTELVESVQRGEPFEDAITTFCRQIIENGQ